MARADLLLSLVRAGVRGDQAQIEKTVEALAAEERAKNHGILADQLMTQLRVPRNGSSTLAPQPQLNGNGRVPLAQLVWDTVPKRRLEDLLLPKEVEQASRELIEEQQRVDLLRSYGLEPRHRVLLAGPPGNGKTTLAEALAEALAAPLLIVRYEAVIGSYLGETSQRIQQVFEYAKTRHCVLFFDEFDAVGKERGDVHETGEIKRVVSSLLMQIDSLPSYVVVVVASNHPELLDRAVWRRFQLRCELPSPNVAQIEEWLRRFQERAGDKLGSLVKIIAENLKGVSFAEVEEFGVDILRRIALAGPEADTSKITKERLAQWKKRFSLVRPRLPSRPKKT